MAKKKKTVLLVLGGLALLGAGYMILKPAAQPTQAPVLPPLPTGGPTGPITPVIVTPPPVVPLKVGDSVLASQLAPGFITEWRGTAYEEGGSNGEGQIEPGKTAGVITAISDINPTSVKVQTYTNNMKSGNALIYNFWMYRNHLKKA